MKRKYEKPSIAVESFQLDAAVAGSCADAGYTLIGFGQDNCGIGSGGEDGYAFMYFSANNCTVDVTGDADDVYHGIGPFLAS